MAPSSDNAGLAVVEALAGMDRPEADISLARLASFSRSEDVADAAKTRLKKRPLYHFVPAMLGSLVATFGRTDHDRLRRSLWPVAVPPGIHAGGNRSQTVGRVRQCLPIHPPK